MLTVTLSIQFGVSVGILDLQIPKRSNKWIEKSFTRNTFSITYFIYLYYSIIYTILFIEPSPELGQTLPTLAVFRSVTTLARKGRPKAETISAQFNLSWGADARSGRSDVTCCGQ